MSIQISDLVGRISSNSFVSGSVIIETKHLFIKHNPGSSLLSSSTLTQRPHLIHFAFSKIRPVFMLIFLVIAALISFPFGSLTEYSLARLRNLQLSAARQSQCMQFSASSFASSKSLISAWRTVFSLHSFSHSLSSAGSREPIRDENLFLLKDGAAAKAESSPPI